MAKSIIKAYCCLIFGGIFGLHYFYLRQDKRGIICFCTFGGFLVGLIYDFFMLSTYVHESNLNQEYVDQVRKDQAYNAVPPFQISSFLNSLLIGTYSSHLILSCIEFDEYQSNNKLYFVSRLIATLVEAVSVYVVGTDGPIKCEFKWPLFGAILGMLTRYLNFEVGGKEAIYCPILGTILLFWNMQWDSEFIYKRNALATNIFKRVFMILLIVSSFLVSLILNLIIEPVGGGGISVLDIPDLLIEKLHDMSEFLALIWNFNEENWTKLLNYFLVNDLPTNRNSYKVIGLSENASQSQINKACKHLSRKWHPDRYMNFKEKSYAQKKFIDIQEACNILSNIRRNRGYRN